MALQQLTNPPILDTTGQAIVTALNAIAAAGGSGGGGGASSTSIAPIESSTTASQAYAVGDLLFYNNILYKVTSAISQGGTIAISGGSPNITETNVDTELKGKVSDISGKTDKVTSATNGDIATLDSNGNLVDSGIASTNVVVKSATAGLLKNDGSVDTNTYPSSSIATPANKQILEYNSTTSKWENKAKFTALVDTLDAGETELAFTNAAITATARFEVYTEDCYLPLIDIVRDNTTLTLTFPEQEEDVNVKVLIYED